MTDHRNVLQSMFGEGNRFPNFGNILMRMRIQGFRCHNDTIIDIRSPITAFCGLNGTGKSTLLQLAAASYGSPHKDAQPYYIKHFIVVGTLDPTPFKPTATVEFKFWDQDRVFKSLTISRNSMTQRWQGYQRRPNRQVIFYGIGLYLPKIEQRDFIVRNANSLKVMDSISATNDVRMRVCTILGINYQDVCLRTVSYSNKTNYVHTVQQSDVNYSESHMGYGEGRILHLMYMLESIPEQSLVLIEEPETSLHPSAQYEFGRYLIDVALRRRHQVMLTTHSEFLLNALPSQSRIYLYKVAGGITTIPGLTSLQAKSLMTDGHVKALNVLVEDEECGAVLREIIRRGDAEFLRTVGIYTGGDENTIAIIVRAVRLTGICLAAVRDGDMLAINRENIFKLPGTLPPEKEMLASQSVKDLFREEYGINLGDFVATITHIDHHEWFERLAQRVNQDRSALVIDASRAYAKGLPENEVVTLVTLLKEASRT